MTDFTAVILAAGEGTRMKSNTPKVLHKVCGVPMLSHVIDAAKGAGAKKIVVVIGSGADEVTNTFKDKHIKFVVQAEQKGTGHALMQAKDEVKNDSLIVVLCGDMPLITKESISSMVETHKKNEAFATVMTARVDDPKGYGRIIRDGDRIIAIREHRDASPREKAICEINSGLYCFDTEAVFSALAKVENKNDQGEYYLTDVVQILNRDKKKILPYEIADPDELIGVNDRCQLANAQSVMQKRIISCLMQEGVTFINPDTSVVEQNVQVGGDTVIYPGVFLEGNTCIGEGCIIIGSTRIKDSQIGNHVEITMSQIQESSIEDNVKIGPFANLRPGCRVCTGAKIGDFIEIKNSNVGEGSKVPHLSYVGDADIGRNSNIGAGVIFVNYDGYKKHRTIVEDGAFIGCNSNLVAPVTIKSGAYVAAGSTVTQEVPEDSLAIARARQENKLEWVKKRKEKLEGGNRQNEQA
jgi:bifunctional UDP-N-acetylglucosamine pyrophosphorylase/glucosamine-1-phosphate N-acetyltransferase